MVGVGGALVLLALGTQGRNLQPPSAHTRVSSRVHVWHAANRPRAWACMRWHGGGGNPLERLWLCGTAPATTWHAATANARTHNSKPHRFRQGRERLLNVAIIQLRTLTAPENAMTTHRFNRSRTTRIEHAASRHAHEA